MDSAENKVKQDAEDYRRRLYDFIPINPGLIDHVRRLDGFNVSTLLLFVPDGRRKRDVND